MCINSGICFSASLWLSKEAQTQAMCPQSWEPHDQNDRFRTKATHCVVWGRWNRFRSIALQDLSGPQLLIGRWLLKLEEQFLLAVSHCAQSQESKPVIILTDSPNDVFQSPKRGTNNMGLRVRCASAAAQARAFYFQNLGLFPKADTQVNSQVKRCQSRLEKENPRLQVTWKAV